MFAWIKTVATAGGRLARTLTALADTCDEINQGLRDQLGLDRPAGGRKPRGQVLDHKPQDADPDAA